MILFNPTPLVPKRQRRTYTVLRVGMFAALLGIGLLAAKSLLFPSQDFAYSFKLQTTKNTLPEPVLTTTDATIKQENIPKDSTIVTYAGTYGDFNSLRVTVTLGKNSAAPETIPFSVRKSYRSFFVPVGDPITAASKDRAFTASSIIYDWDGTTLSPLLSDAATLSRFDRKSVTPATSELLRVFPPTQDTVGFRIGSLLSDTEGVFAVTSASEIRPIGSTDVFRALGFDWKDVIPANEEELQFYKKGKIMLFDAEQPDGTLFHDRDNGTTFVMNGGKRRPITDPTYASFLATKSTPIEASGKALDTPAACTLVKEWFSLFTVTYTCTVPLTTLGTEPGGSYELSITAPDNLRLASIDTTFETDLTHDNFSIAARKIRDRFLSRYQK